jgi:hypothetical protein
MLRQCNRRLQKSRNTHYRWQKEDEDYTEAVLEQSEVILDIAESKLLEKVQEGDIRAIMFILKTKGKARGYDEKRTVSVNQQVSGTPQIHFGDTSTRYEIVTKEMSQTELDDIGFVDS